MSNEANRGEQFEEIVKSVVTKALEFEGGGAGRRPFIENFDVNKTGKNDFAMFLVLADEDDEIKAYVKKIFGDLKLARFTKIGFFVSHDPAAEYLVADDFLGLFEIHFNGVAVAQLWRRGKKRGINKKEISGLLPKVELPYLQEKDVAGILIIDESREVAQSKEEARPKTLAELFAESKTTGFRPGGHVGYGGKIVGSSASSQWSMKRVKGIDRNPK